MSPVSWMRWECAAQAHDLLYMKGFYEVVDTIRSEFPSLYIEGCAGGATTFDLGMVSRTHGTWLNDHTANPDVCRFLQTGALRFWPSHYLNMAVRAHRNTGDAEAALRNVLSRMPGTLSFNGDIAQWSDEAAQRVREWVDIYKKIRPLQSQSALFPIQQPRTMNDWDVVLYGDGPAKDNFSTCSE